MDMSKDFLSVYELAEELNVHHNTIRNAIKAGRINAFRITGGKKSALRIPRTEIIKLATDDFKKMRAQNE